MRKRLPFTFSVVAVLGLPAFTVFMWLSPALDYEFFCKGDESCFRQWVSALSGWVAVAAAAVTVHFLRQQIAEANRHQRENIELNIMSKLTLAHSYLDELTIIGGEVNECEELFYALTDPMFELVSEVKFFDLKARMQSIDTALAKAVVSEFERNIGTGIEHPVPQKAIAEAFRMAEDRRTLLNPPQSIPENLSEKRILDCFRTATKSTQSYKIEGQRQAIEFLIKWERRIE